jgi:hypothetical protein
LAETETRELQHLIALQEPPDDLPQSCAGLVRGPREGLAGQVERRLALKRLPVDVAIAWGDFLPFLPCFSFIFYEKCKKIEEISLLH